ncbi:hypothetical protein LZ31DRAFT_339541 [Colletotrichum somersetense]|nr:hypothetical protein LZ31DRAFT_339541 [Colletotrichum somersetense]
MLIAASDDGLYYNDNRGHIPAGWEIDGQSKSAFQAPPATRVTGKGGESQGTEAKVKANTRKREEAKQMSLSVSGKGQTDATDFSEQGTRAPSIKVVSVSNYATPGKGARAGSANPGRMESK